jgi:hypothetical protein
MLEHWEIGRMISFYAVAPHSKKIKSVTDIIKLPSDSKKVKLNTEKKAKFRLLNGNSKS